MDGHQVHAHLLPVDEHNLVTDQQAAGCVHYWGRHYPQTPRNLARYDCDLALLDLRPQWDSVLNVDAVNVDLAYMLDAYWDAED